MPKTNEDWINELISGEDERSEAAALKLAEIGEDIVSDLGTLLDHVNPDFRWWATRTISNIPHRKSTILLCKAIKDPEISVRHCAAVGLHQQPTPEAIPALISMLAEPDQLSARLAGNALTAVGKDAVPALIELLQNTTNSGRTEAARALAIIKDESAVSLFYQLIKNGDSSMVEYWADIGLQNLGIGMAFFHPK